MNNNRRTGDTFGTRLRRERLKQGFTLEELGGKIGVTKGAVAKWEHGDTLPEVQNLIPLHKALGISVDELLGISQKQKGNVEVYQNQNAANVPIREFIRSTQPSELFLIQYVSVSIREVIDTFSIFAPSEPRPQIYLLIKYPGSEVVEEEESLELKKRGIHSIEPGQFDKIKAQLGTLLVYDKGLIKADLHIRCYHAPGAMRAAYIGYPSSEKLSSLLPDHPDRRPDQKSGLLSMSMSRYTGRPGGVIGHDNPLIHVYSNTHEGALLCSLFETTFRDLWEDSEPGEEVLRNITEEQNKKKGR